MTSGHTGTCLVSLLVSTSGAHPVLFDTNNRVVMETRVNFIPVVPHLMTGVSVYKNYSKVEVVHCLFPTRQIMAHEKQRGNIENINLYTRGALNVLP